MAVGDWYESAASNTTLAPENCAPSAINDAIRAVQAAVAEHIRDDTWVQYGSGTGPGTIAWVSSTSFKITGVDIRSAYHAGRKVKITGTLTGTVYAVIASSSYSTDTTVVIADNTGSLVNEALTVWLGMVPATNSPLPYDYSSTSYAQRIALSDRTGTGEILRDIVYGYNGSSARREYVRATVGISDNTAAAEDGYIAWSAYDNGTLTTQMQAGQGVVIGTPTGGFLGTGTLNLASDVYVNGTKVSGPATTTVAGIAELATLAEVTAGTDGTRIVTAASLEALTSRNASQGQVVFPGGLTIKYGTQPITASPTTVTFTSAFPTACVSVNATAISSSGAYRAAMVTSQSTANFVCERFSDAGASSNVAFNWIAVGY